MLKARVITAGLLLPLVLAIILYCQTIVVSAFAGMVLILAGWEWTNLIGIEKTWLRLAYIVLIAAGSVITKYFAVPVYPICLLAIAWWLLGLLAIIIYPRLISFWTKPWFGICVGWLLFMPTWLGMDWLHGQGSNGQLWLIFLLFLVWTADIGAYFSGKLWGKKKLLPAVSAGKTWFGVFGAFCSVFFLALIFSKFFLREQDFLILASCGLLVLVFSIIGDLVESLFKRVRGCKDSGSLLPGHGGVLDRIDGLLAAVPAFVVGLIFIEKL